MQTALENISRDRWRILLLTCRDPATDFRLPLAQELQAIGHNVTYTFLKMRPTVVDMAKPSKRCDYSLPNFLIYAFREFHNTSPLLVFNSTNLAFPLLGWLLRLLCGGCWCFDMHDDLTYGKTGWARTKALTAQRILLQGSDFLVHSAPTLSELFPLSIHLGNASDIQPISRPNPDYFRVLILASLDERFDFDFLSKAAVASPELTFEIYGKISQDDPHIARCVADLGIRHMNIVYRGPYTNAELPRILAEYAVTLAPYVTEPRMTRYLDPLRYYHCLNSGMEVLSTEIPKAKEMEKRLYLVQDPCEVGPIVFSLRDRPSVGRNVAPKITGNDWRSRAVALMQIASAQLRIKSPGSTK